MRYFLKNLHFFRFCQAGFFAVKNDNFYSNFYKKSMFISVFICDNINNVCLLYGILPCKIYTIPLFRIPLCCVAVRLRGTRKNGADRGIFQFKAAQARAALFFLYKYFLLNFLKIKIDCFRFLPYIIYIKALCKRHCTGGKAKSKIPERST